jgi:hypothetical protein
VQRLPKTRGGPCDRPTICQTGWMMIAPRRKTVVTQCKLARPFDRPELRIRASPPIVLRRTTDALEFIRRMPLKIPSRAWQDALQEFEARASSAASASWLRSNRRRHPYANARLAGRDLAKRGCLPNGSDEPLPVLDATRRTVTKSFGGGDDVLGQGRQAS